MNIARNGSATLQAAAANTLNIDRAAGNVRAFDARGLKLPGVGSKKTAVGARTIVPRHIYNARNEATEDFRRAWEIVCADPAPPPHPTGCDDVNIVYEHLAGSANFFLDVLHSAGKQKGVRPIRAAVHVGDNYLNAHWTKGMLYFGDGDGDLFQPFGRALDIVAHEWFHGILEPMLQYDGEPGALNESLADIFASLVKQHTARQDVDAADWLIGDSLFTAKYSGQAVRSLRDPGSAYSNEVMGTDPQPKHWDDWVDTEDDDGGVHINSGIPNHAFYLASTALAGAGYGRQAWTTAGRIWYAAVSRQPLRRGMNFARFAARTVTSAGKLFDPQAATIVQGSWEAVGIEVRRR